MVTVVVVETDFVVTLNVAVVAPAAIVMELGTVATVELLLSITLAPPVTAGLVNVTVPVSEVPPVTLDALKLTDDSAAVLLTGLTVNIADLLLPW